MYETTSKKKTVLNQLDNRGDLQIRLWKKKYNFTKANIILKGYGKKMKKSGDKCVNDTGETGDREQSNCGHSLPDERPHSIDACCQNKPDA